jgi:hypothetical protein
MADTLTRGDAVRVFLTGAASDGGAQANPDAALGAYRSSTEVQPLGIQCSSLPANLTVDFASGANGAGAGTLAVKGVNSIAWTPPSGTEGPAVTIANGETKVCEGGGTNEQWKFIRVSRTSADDLTGGPATVTLTAIYNSLFAMDNILSAERAAGESEYRGGCFKNVSAITVPILNVWLKELATAASVNAAGYVAAGAITITRKTGSFDTDGWPESGFVENDDTGEVMYYSSRTATALTVPAAGRDVWTDVAGGAAGSEDDVLSSIPGCRIAKEPPNAQPDGFAQTIANENTAPAGLTWKHAHADDDADRIQVGSLAAGYIYFLWIQRKVIAGATAEALVEQYLEYTFDAQS